MDDFGLHTWHIAEDLRWYYKAVSPYLYAISLIISMLVMHLILTMF